MAQTHRISSPGDLQTISKRHESSPAGTEITIVLALFQPLTDPEIFSASRSRDPERIWRGKKEYLDLTALSKAWRTPWVTFLKSLVTANLTITFDPTLPEHRGADGLTQGIWWSVDDGEKERVAGARELYVIDREFWAMVVVLATEGRMVSRGGIRLDLVGDGMHGWGESNMRRLQGYLETLSK